MHRFTSDRLPLNHNYLSNKQGDHVGNKTIKEEDELDMEMSNGLKDDDDCKSKNSINVVFDHDIKEVNLDKDIVFKNGIDFSKREQVDKKVSNDNSKIQQSENNKHNSKISPFQIKNENKSDQNIRVIKKDSNEVKAIKKDEKPYPKKKKNIIIRKDENSDDQM